MTTRDISRLLAVELTSLGEAALLHIPTFQVVGARRSAHVTRAFGVLRFIRSWTESGLLEGQGTGAAHSIVVAGLHQALVKWWTLWFARLLATQKGSHCVIDGKGQSSGTEISQRSGLLAGGHWRTWLRFALHLLQLAGLSTRTLQAIAGIPAAANGASRVRISGESRGAEHAAGGGGTVLGLRANHSRSRLVPTARQFHAVFIHTPAIPASFLILTLDSVEVTVLLAARHSDRWSLKSRLQSFGSSRLRTS